MSYYDNIVGCEVLEFTHNGRQWRFPKIINGRYEVVQLLTVSGFGALLVANDTWIFNRKVLIKTGFIEDRELKTRNNASIPDLVSAVNKQYEHEYKVLLLAQMRQISGIPTLIDWCQDVSPLIRGPHRDDHDNDFFHNDPEFWHNIYYLVLSYFDGLQLDKFCQTKPQRVLDKPTEFFKSAMIYITKIFSALHETRSAGGQNMKLIYQDLKPANILYNPGENRYCLIDFGGVAVRVETSTDDRVVNAGVHTEEFAPPEATSTPLDPDVAIRPTWDIYTIGTTIHKCITLAGVERKVSDALIGVINKCKAQSPNDRFQSISDLENELYNV